MKHARDVLNEIKFRDGLEFSNVIIYYRDRKMNQLNSLLGNEIKSWDKSFIYTATGSSIPLHRIEVIVHNDEELYRHKR